MILNIVNLDRHNSKLKFYFFILNYYKKNVDMV